MLSRINLVNQIYFVTTKTCNNNKIFDNDWACELFIKNLKECKKKYEFKLYGYVVMPDHVHLLIEPAKSFNISQVIQKIKSIFAKEFKKELKYRVAASLARGAMAESKTFRYADVVEPGKPIWQKSFYDHAIRNKKDFIEKLNYIHKNPLKHNLTNNVDNYHWSSYQNYYLDNEILIKIDRLEM